MIFNNFSSTAVMAAVAFTQGVLGKLVIKNHCNKDVFIRTSQGDQCEMGKGGCINDGFKPWKVPKGKHTWSQEWLGMSVSVKISKDGEEGILQYEYSHEPAGLWWNLSDLDGEGPGLVGTPFRADDVGITPSGNGYMVGDCVDIRCKANEVCLDSYQHPDDPKTRWCPTDTGVMHVDLCIPKKDFEDDGIWGM
jgi:hypothetical protein